jgi:hypothetical protein
MIRSQLEGLNDQDSRQFANFFGIPALIGFASVTALRGVSGEANLYNGKYGYLLLFGIVSVVSLSQILENSGILFRRSGNALPGKGGPLLRHAGTNSRAWNMQNRGK